MDKDTFIDRLTVMTREEITNFILSNGKKKDDVELPEIGFEFDFVKK